MTVDGQPPMMDEQAIIVFLRHVDHALSDALRDDEQRRLRWLTAIHALVMAVLLSVAWCSASIWSAPVGSGLLTLDGSSIQAGPEGSRRIVWMIKQGRQLDKA